MQPQPSLWSCQASLSFIVFYFQFLKKIPTFVLDCQIIQNTAQAKMRICKQSVHINYHCVDRAVCQSCSFYDDEMQNFAKFSSTTKYSWLPRRNAFSWPKSKSLKKYILPALQKQPSIRSASQSSSETISIQILLLFKLVQASKVDKTNDGQFKRCTCKSCIQQRVRRENLRVHMKNKHNVAP